MYLLYVEWTEAIALYSSASRWDSVKISYNAVRSTLQIPAVMRISLKKLFFSFCLCIDCRYIGHTDWNSTGRILQITMCSGSE
jgi:hypothetical protein